MNLKVTGHDTTSGYSVSSISTDADHSEDDAFNTVMQTLRGRSRMFSGLGYLILGEGKLNINRIL